MDKLKHFTDKNGDQRRWMANIQKQENFLYATDAHVMCRRKYKDSEDYDFDQSATYILKDWFVKGKKVGEIQLKPFFEMLEAHKTQPVYANKMVACSECECDGYLMCDLDHEHDCEDCDDGRISVPDETKQISTKIPDNALIEVESSNDIRYCFNVSFFYKLQHLGDSAKIYYCNKVKDALLFSSKGYEALIMRILIETESEEKIFLSTVNFTKK